MAPLRRLAIALAAAAVLTVLGGLGVAVFAPEPDCSGGGGVYCREEAYEGLRTLVVLLWLAGLALLVAAVGVVVAHLRRSRPRHARAFVVQEPGPRTGVSFQRAGAAEPPARVRAGRPPRPPPGR